ncbi:NUDIX domain-containing protein [Streptomyces bathyalis]|uniref:8-oxo-dGTP diphosphatase n=2 Tax=Streptomyces bathyalis TaxID=2710756 RepID=A0A7T1WTA7_9ACTN|nr:NUDIX domain-containing protein [Streptomyces bathyalis]
MTGGEERPALAELERQHLTRRCCVTLTIPLLAEPEALSPVRHRIGAYFELWGLPELAEVARLCVSELLTNAIVHVGPGTPVTLHASMARPRPRLSLTDPAPGALPLLQRAEDDAESGRGLALLDALTLRCGVDSGKHSKTVWCELDSRPNLATSASRLPTMTDEANPPRVVVGGAICDQGRLLAARRTAPPALAGRWELPGGKVEPGETPDQALVRELHEELGIEIEAIARVPGEWPLKQDLVLHVWQARLLKGEPQPLQDHDELRWLAPDEAFDVDWLDQDRPAVGAVMEALTRPASQQP